jgi:hypothetical protein
MARTVEGGASDVESRSPDDAAPPGDVGGPAADDAAGADGVTLRTLLGEALPIGVVAFVAYTLTLSSVPALTHDSLTYMQSITDGGIGLWHPHHLVYNAIGAAWLRLVRSFGVVSDGLKVVAWVNSALGAASAMFCYALLRDRARAGRMLAFAGTLGAAVSFGLWFYSVSVEVYVLPLSTLLAATYVLLSPRLTTRHVLLVGLLNGLSVLGHQIHVLFTVVVVVVLAGHVRRVGRATVLRWFALWAATAFAVVVTAYGLVLWFVVKPQSLAEAHSWFTRYAAGDEFWVSPGLSTLPRAAFGVSRAIVGGHFLFRFDWVRDLLDTAIPGKSLTDEAFLVRGLWPGLAGLLILTAFVGGLLLVAVLAHGVRHRRQVPPAARRVLVALGAWMVAYTLFFLLWEPTNVEFWIPQVTCLWLVAAALCARAPAAAEPAPTSPPEPEPEPEPEPDEVTASDEATAAAVAAPARARPDRWAGVLLAAAVLVGLTNLAGSILPAVDTANDVYAYRFRALGTVVGTGDAVVVDRPYLTIGYNRRHTGAGAIPGEPWSATVGPVDPEDSFSPEVVLLQVQTVLDSGHRVAVEPELVDDPVSEAGEETGELLRQVYGDRWRRVEAAPDVEWIVIDPVNPFLTPPPELPS